MQKQSCLRDFDVLGKLGEGAFGQVFKVKRKADGKEYAMKKVKIGAMKEKERQNALNEIRILASYDGEYIIGYKEAFYDEVSGTLCVVMEFASGGDILKKNQLHTKARTRYKQQQIWRALVHMTKGLKSLHDKKILHRDLKCANIFVSDDIYKLGDLNVSKVLKKDLAQTQTGTPYYASPQVWKDKPYGVKSDMWSLGCVLYEMAALRPPFTAHDLQGLYKKVCIGVFQRIPMVYSNDLASVVSSLLKVQPSKRPSTQELLNNPIIQKRYNGQIITNDTENDCDQLLKTIKYNPKDLKGLKKILPKANYEEEEKKLAIEEMRGGINSCKNSRKSSQPQVVNDQKLKDFLEKRRSVEQKQRQRQVLLLKQQKDEIAKKRERVLSACGVRKSQFSCDSPRVAVHNKKDSYVDSKNSQSGKKVEQKNPPQPPKVPRPPQQKQQQPQQGINYKLPPRPSSRQQQGSNSNRVGNISYDYNNRDRGSSSRERSYERIVEKQRSKSKQKTKQNLKKAGQKVVSARGMVRSSSAQRVVYPSWWG